MTKILRGDRNQCPTCNLYFNSTLAFTKHRIGDYTTAQRRCLIESEMLDKGMSLKATGWWVSAQMPTERLPQAKLADLLPNPCLTLPFQINASNRSIPCR